MDEGEIREKFIESAYLVEPLFLFESGNDRKAAVECLLSNCEKLSGNERAELYTWLGRLLEDSSTYCFHGSSLVLQPSADVDMLLLTTVPGMLYFRKPHFVNVLDLQRVEGNLGSDWGCFFLGPLLFPRTPHEFILNTVDYCRQEAFSRPFFDGGYGESLTYAAFKAMGKPDLFGPEDWEAVRHLKRFDIKYRRFDNANMLTVSYSVKEVNGQIRKMMCQLEEKEMRALARAAARKLGIKEGSRNDVSEKFVSELKALRQH